VFTHKYIFPHDRYWNTMFQPQQRPQNHKKMVSQRIQLLHNLC
jgi:hypothetical protein